MTRHTMLLGKTEHLTASTCGVCGKITLPSHISLMDHDFRKIVCVDCSPHVLIAEITLSTTPGVRQPVTGEKR